MSRGDFWSRRRAAVAAEAPARTVDAPEPKSDDEVLAELGLPVPETLRSGDDVAAFMARAVPAALRRRALRAVWRSNPVLACLDGLNDYDGDFTDAATCVPDLKTAYEVGRGIVANVEKMAAAPERVEPAPAVAREVAPAPALAMEAEDDAEDTAPRPRRMAFAFGASA